MIINVTINHYKVFSNKVCLSLEGDSHSKRLDENIYHSDTGFNSLKAVGIFGPNNVGKSSLLEALSIIKMVLSGRNVYIPPDILGKNNITDLETTFLYHNKVYSYKFKYDSTLVDSSPIGFIYERLALLTKGSEKRNKETLIYEIDTAKDKYIYSGNSKLSSLLRGTSRGTCALFSVNPSISIEIASLQKEIRGFSDSLEIIRGERVSLSKTIEIFKRNEDDALLLKELIKDAGLGIEDFGYDALSSVSSSASLSPLGEGVPSETSEDAYHLYSIKEGDESNRRVPFLLIDSGGTRKVVALAGYIVDALKSDKTIIIDELGNSLHIGLCTAIISMFNSELNRGAQLIFTSHDTALLDTSLLFRKDQIWFLSREEGKQYLYSLADFNAAKDGARPTSNNAEKYRLGMYGAVPKINIYSALADIEETRADASKGDIDGE
ncbi:MAG: ATP-binding protein [Coprobacillus sp.]|nr:ATP-binding protein [Coprobacillus sp.]